MSSGGFIFIVWLCVLAIWNRVKVIVINANFNGRIPFDVQYVVWLLFDFFVGFARTPLFNQCTNQFACACARMFGTEKNKQAKQNKTKQISNEKWQPMFFLQSKIVTIACYYRTKNFRHGRSKSLEWKVNRSSTRDLNVCYYFPHFWHRNETISCCTFESIRKFATKISQTDLDFGRSIPIFWLNQVTAEMNSFSPHP